MNVIVICNDVIKGNYKKGSVCVLFYFLKVVCRFFFYILKFIYKMEIVKKIMYLKVEKSV